MILKFIYKSTGYLGTENSFFVDFGNKTISDYGKKCDKEVYMRKSGELDSLRRWFIREAGYKVID